MTTMRDAEVMWGALHEPSGVPVGASSLETAERRTIKKQHIRGATVERYADYLAAFPIAEVPLLEFHAAPARPPIRVPSIVCPQLEHMRDYLRGAAQRLGGIACGSDLRGGIATPVPRNLLVLAAAAHFGSYYHKLASTSSRDVDRSLGELGPHEVDG